MFRNSSHTFQKFLWRHHLLKNVVMSQKIYDEICVIWKHGDTDVNQKCDWKNLRFSSPGNETEFSGLFVGVTR